MGCIYQKSNFYGGVIIFGYSVEIIKGEMKAGDDMEDLKYYDLDSLPPVAFNAHIYLINKMRVLVDGDK